MGTNTQNGTEEINNGQNQAEVNEEIIRYLLQPNVETFLVLNGMVMAQINIQRDEYSDYLYALMEYRLGRLHVIGVGLSIEDAIHNALWRAAQVGDSQIGDIEKIKKIKAFETAAYGLGGEDNE